MKILIYVVVFLIYSALKPFLDVFLYNMFSATYGPGTDTTALYCGIFAAIFAVSAISCAQWLCKRWEKKQSAKAQHSAHTEAEPEAPTPEELPAPQPEPEPTITDPTAPAPATPKLRFCKHCGSPIDPATRRCTGCGKQYFRPPVFQKKHLAIAAATISAIVATAFVFALISQLNTAQTKIAELNAQASELEDIVAEQRQQINTYKVNESDFSGRLAYKNEVIEKLREENATYRKYLDYCEWYCAYVTITDGKISSTIYHRLDCPYTEDADSLGILYIDFLEGEGFTACSRCYG